MRFIEILENELLFLLRFFDGIWLNMKYTMVSYQYRVNCRDVTLMIGYKLEAFTSDIRFLGHSYFYVKCIEMLSSSKL